MKLTVKLDAKAINSANIKTRRAARNSARNVINKRVTEVVREVVDETSKATNIKKVALNNRLDETGKAKAKRVTRVNATTKQLRSIINVDTKSIPMFLLAGKQLKQGVKAKKQLYKGAFRARGRVYYRKRAGGLNLPRFGIRKQFIERYDKKLITSKSKRLLVDRWNIEMRKQLARLNK